MTTKFAICLSTRPRHTSLWRDYLNLYLSVAPLPDTHTHMWPNGRARDIILYSQLLHVLYGCGHQKHMAQSIDTMRSPKACKHGHLSPFPFPSRVLLPCCMQQLILYYVYHMVQILSFSLLVQRLL